MGLRRCCCRCVELIDLFVRTLGTIAADGVNVLNSLRYQFTEGDWHVDYSTPGSEVLVCDTTDSPITFARGKKSIVVDVTLAADGDYAVLTNGTNELRITADETADKWLLDFDGRTDEVANGGSGTTFPRTITLEFLLVMRNDELAWDVIGQEHPSAKEICRATGAEADLLYVRALGTGMSRAMGCFYTAVDLSAVAGGYVWQLQAVAGTEFDALEVYRPARTGSPEDLDTPKTLPCTKSTYNCNHVCQGIRPATLTVAMSGFAITQTPCGTDNTSDGFDACSGDCITAWLACLFVATTAAERCDCNDARGDCQCACNTTHLVARTACPGSVLNAEFVLDREGDGECSGPCMYRGTFDVGSIFQGNLTCTEQTFEIEIEGELTIEYYDEPTETLYCRLSVTPFVSSAVAFGTWETADITAAALCAGDTFALTGPTEYADDIRIGSTAPLVSCDHLPAGEYDSALTCRAPSQEEDEFATTMPTGSTLTLPGGMVAGYEIGSTLTVTWDGGEAVIEITDIDGDDVDFTFVSGDALPAADTDIDVHGVVLCDQTTTIIPTLTYPGHTPITIGPVETPETPEP